MFDDLIGECVSVVKRLKGKVVVSQKDLDAAMKKLRSALIEADVSLVVIKELISSIVDQIVGSEVIDQVSPGEMIAKIMEDELAIILGSEDKKSNDNILNLSSKSRPSVILTVGLQGCGKTTTSSKLAFMLKNQGKNVLMSSLDVYRPAAKEQLKVLGENIGVSTVPIVENEKPIEIAKRSLKLGTEYDVLILDTAGRLHVDSELMLELEEVSSIAKPSEILLIADSLTGQAAVDIATTFHKKLSLTGIILTRADGDSRGGAAVSMRYVTNCPIKFLGTGEKPSCLEPFHPKRMARRILGMGDVVSLVEKASEIMGKKQIDDLNVKVKSGNFDFNDLKSQLSALGKLGGIASVMKFIPGMSNVKLNDSAERDVKKSIAMISSMTKYERSHPDVLNYSRKQRIILGSATKMSDINLLINKLKKAKELAAQASKFGIGNIDTNSIKNFFSKGK